MFRSVEGNHLSDIGRLDWQKQQQLAPFRILKISFNGTSTVIVHA